VKRQIVRSAWVWMLGLTLGGSLATQAAPPPLTAHHLQVSVADVDTLAQWYVAKLGFRIVKRLTAGTAKVVWIDIPGFRLGLVQVVGSSRPASNSLLPPRDATVQGFRQLHFSVPSVDTAYAALAADGVRFVVEPTTYSVAGIRIATLSDPEGNLISLYEDVDPANALLPPRS
jgi:catechol 2,3-dioxygenase-like lactoylglutathione lyase family enzyme